MELINQTIAMAEKVAMVIGLLGTVFFIALWIAPFREAFSNWIERLSKKNPK